MPLTGESTLLVVAVGGFTISSAVLILMGTLTKNIANAESTCKSKLAIGLVLICSPKMRNKEGFRRDCYIMLAWYIGIEYVNEL